MRGAMSPPPPPQIRVHGIVLRDNFTFMGVEGLHYGFGVSIFCAGTVHNMVTGCRISVETILLGTMQLHYTETAVAP
jgi:hypothetical protein